MMVQQDLNPVVGISLVTVYEQLVLQMVVDEPLVLVEQLVLYIIIDDQLMLYMIDVVEEVDRIVVVEEMLKTVNYTVVGCIGVRSAKVLSLVEAGVFGVGGTSTVPN
ncbi:hypothetical protein Tco_0640466 [Tanacetum coccineum]